MPRSLLTPVAAFCVALAWSGSWITGKLALASAPPLEISAVRFMIAAVVLAAIAIATRTSMGRDGARADRAPNPFAARDRDDRRADRRRAAYPTRFLRERLRGRRRLEHRGLAERFVPRARGFRCELHRLLLGCASCWRWCRCHDVLPRAGHNTGDGGG